MLLVLAVVGKVIESADTAALIVLLAALVTFYVIWRFRKNLAVSPSQVNALDDQQPGQPEAKESHEESGRDWKENYGALGLEVKSMFADLATPVKNELRKTRGASAYDAIFTAEFVTLICRFAALDGTIDASEGKVFSEIFKALHPRTYAGLSPDEAVKLLEGHLTRHPETLQVPILNSLLFRLTQQASEELANRLKALMYKVAVEVALADGPLSSLEQRELEPLRPTSPQIEDCR